MDELLNEMIVLEHHDRKFKLMGQILSIESHGIYIFVMNLMVQTPDELTTMGLSFNDFAVQDQIFDFLMLAQTQKRTLQEAESLNQKLIETTETAIKASQMKSQFLANMSHELRTPMNGVLGMAGLLADTQLSLEQKDYVDGITKSGEVMLTLINDILDLSKIEAGHIQLVQEDFELITVLENVFKTVQPSCLKKDIHLSYEVAASCPRYLSTDRHRLQQVLLNFISNAIKFTDKGYVKVTVSTFTDAKSTDHPQIKFIIKDTGIGMDIETQKKIFHPFVQADSSMSKKFGGTGLGLSICRKLIYAMGGEFGVLSQPGQGSEFWFTINTKSL